MITINSQFKQSIEYQKLQINIIMSYYKNVNNPYSDYQNMPSPRNQPTSQSSNRPPNDSFYFINQPNKTKKQFGMFSKRYLPKDTSSIHNKSKISQNMTSSNLQQTQEQKLYTEEMLFLIGEQENNIRYFKEKLDAQKERIRRDFQNIKKHMDHIFQDLEISFIAEIDIVYKDFINRYRDFKQYMVTLKEIRRTLMNQLPQQNDYLTKLNQNKTNSLSNRDLLGQIEKDANIFRTQKIYSQITDLQRQNVIPARQLASQLITMGSIQAEYYNQCQTNELMKRIINSLKQQTKLVYPEIKNYYIKSSELILKELLKNKNQNILNGLSYYQNNEEINDDRNNFRSADHKDVLKIGAATSRKTQFKSYEDYSQRLNQPKKYTRPVSSSSDLKGIASSIKPPKSVSIAQRDDSSKDDKKSRNYHMGNLKQQTNKHFQVSIEQQNISAQWIEDINLRQVAIIEAYQNNEAMLCGIFAVEGKFLVIGGKDKILRVYQVSSGKLMYALNGHDSNICSLANHGPYISSGGDHGCSSLIIWDCKTWNIRSKIQLHNAAVTCIVDLQDSINLATASYDKKINIFNYRRNSCILNVNSLKAGVACMTITSDKLRLISSELDNSISVWKLSRQGTNITNIQLEKHFVNDSLVCSLRSFALKGNYFIVGTKQGKIQIINCLTGETIRKLNVGTTPIVQMILFQRQNKIQSPLVISCCSKQKSLFVIKTETGMNSLIDMKGKLNVEIGCGIGPKCIVSESGLMGIVSQSPMLKQILIYQISIL